MNGFWGELVVSAMSGSIIALFALWFSLGQFRKERLWERRLDAYTQAIDTLHTLKIGYQTLLNAKMAGRNLPEDFVREVEAKTNQARAQIRRSIDVGELLFEKRAVDELEGLFSALSKAAESEEYVLFLDGAHDAVVACLKSVRGTARQHLRLGSIETT